MAKTATVTTVPVYDPYPFDLRALVHLFVVGLATGLIGWLLYLAITNFFIEPVFCSSPETFSICNNGGTIAWASAHIIAAAAAVAVLARIAAYRPLLVVIAVLVALWGANTWLGGLVWYQGLLWEILLFGVAMTLFGWIARIPNFIISLAVTVLLVVLARLALMNA